MRCLVLLRNPKAVMQIMRLHQEKAKRLFLFKQNEEELVKPVPDEQG